MKSNGTTLEKHAYLIMAHHRPDLLCELLEALDDPRNDIFLHIDSKSDMKAEDFSTKYSKLVVIPRMNVNWGGPSQVACTLELLKAATGTDTYSYYHLITGSSYPLKSQDYIHNFFCTNKGKELVQLNSTIGSEQRVKYRWLFNEAGKLVWQKRWKGWLRQTWLYFQEALGVNRFRKYRLTFAKGLAYWSITHEFAMYILEKEALIKEMLKHSSCGDEVFVQILAMNSRFADRLYNGGKSLRYTTWTLEGKGHIRDGHNFEMCDLPLLLECDELFALKFEGPDGPAIIDCIKAHMQV